MERHQVVLFVNRPNAISTIISDLPQKSHGGRSCFYASHGFILCKMGSNFVSLGEDILQVSEKIYFDGKVRYTSMALEVYLAKSTDSA